MFNGAHDFVIHNGTFIHNQNVVQSGIDILLEASTPEAALDAGEGDYVPTCYPGTREQYIKDITTWAIASNSDHLPVYWMRGPAGVGKSALAQACAQKVKEAGYLGAAFFFSVNGRRKDHTRFFPSLAYQLSTTLPDYREIVDRRISNDRTLITKTMKAQFQSLIIEPLQELMRQGKELRKRVVFIDGLDECKDKDAQVEIINLIVSSIHVQSAPICWAVFSRPEPHIVSTFDLTHISPHCHSVNLPISRDSDKEIEIYLRGGFENILHRRNVKLSSPWPTDEDIKKLVNAAAGLFAYSATVLGFVDSHSYSGFQETLQTVLSVIALPRSQPITPFTELDRLYTLILQGVSADTLPLLQLFLSHMAQDNSNGRDSLHVAITCNALGISEAVFKSISNQLQAVVTYQENPQPFTVVNPKIDLTRSFYDQDPSFKRTRLSMAMSTKVHGTIAFLHKSFYDFLINPSRSSTFCVTTWKVRCRLFDQLGQQHLHFASTYSVQGSKLVLQPGDPSSSVSLSWPHGTEFADSVIKLFAFHRTSHYFRDNALSLALFSDKLSPASVQKLSEFDYYKSLIADRMLNSSLRWRGNKRTGTVLRSSQVINGTGFGRLEGWDPNKFDPILKVVERLKNLGIIKPYHPRLPSTFASLSNTYSRLKRGKHSGLYELGSGERSVIWYWECDVKERYFHDFQTLNYEDAMRIYEAGKFDMWDGS